MGTNQKKRTAGSAIWSLALSPSGNRVLISTGYPDLSLVMVHGKGDVIFKTHLGSVAGVACVNPSDLGAFVGLTARQGAGNILRVDGQGRQLWQCTTQRRIESLALGRSSDIFYVGTKEGSILALNASGKRLWVNDFGQQRGSVTVRATNDRIMAFTSRGYMYFFDNAGNIRFRSSTRLLFERVAVSAGMEYCEIAGVYAPAIVRETIGGVGSAQSPAEDDEENVLLVRWGQSVNLTLDEGQLEQLFRGEYLVEVGDIRIRR